jgi:four helix bundle protein
MRKCVEAEGRRGGGEEEKKTVASRMHIESHRELEVYQMAFEAAMRIFELTKHFPKEECFSLTDQIRRSSRSVCANLAEAWRKRRYEGAFLSKLNDAEAEAAETQTWLEFAVQSNYLDAVAGRELFRTYDNILGKLVNMIHDPSPWLIRTGEPWG